MQEARATSRLAHPNIIDVLDMGQDPELGALYIVEEFLTGHDLRVHLNVVGRMAPRDALDVILPVMEALSEAHAHGIVHRDLKPDNIFLAETSRGVVPTLIDFGVAKIVAVSADEASLQTRAGMLMGTPSYMAPEQGRGDATLDGRADVWSIGVVLYEMLSGARPHDALTPIGLIAQIIYQDPRPLSEAAPELPADLVDAVMRALQRDIAKRYPTMKAFEDALRACAAMRDGPPAAASPRPPDLTPSTPPIRSPRRAWWVALVAALGVGVALLLAALTSATDRADRPSQTATTATAPPRPPPSPPSVPAPVLPAPVLPAPPAANVIPYEPPPPRTSAPTAAPTPRRVPTRTGVPVRRIPLPRLAPRLREHGVSTGVPVIE